MGYAHDYAAAIMQRGRVPMAPADFVPNWSDGPRKAKYYPGSTACRCPPPATRPTRAWTAPSATRQRRGRGRSI